MEKLFMFGGNKTIEKFTIRYADINEAYKKINDIVNTFDKIRYVDSTAVTGMKTLADGTTLKYNPKIDDAIDNINIILNAITFSLNRVSAEMSSLWEINGVYKNSCNDINDVAKLAREFIKRGVPSKYVRHNIMLVLSKELNSSEPTMGQSRCVFFPKNKSVVLKVAMNGVGIQGNRAEYNITKALDRLGETDIVSSIVDSWNDFTVVTADKCNMSTLTKFRVDLGLANGEINELQQRLKNIIDDPSKKFPYNITDLHSENVAKNKNGKFVFIDYGMWVKGSALSN